MATERGTRMTRMTRMAAPARMGADALVQEALTRRVIGAFADVHDGHGHGVLESVCARLAFELRDRGLSGSTGVPLEVACRGTCVGSLRVDLLVESVLVLELRATPALHEADHRQLLNDLRASDLQVGLLLHFGPAPSFRRAVATRSAAASHHPR